MDLLQDQVVGIFFNRASLFVSVTCGRNERRNRCLSGTSIIETLAGVEASKVCWRRILVSIFYRVVHFPKKCHLLSCLLVSVRQQVISLSKKDSTNSGEASVCTVSVLFVKYTVRFSKIMSTLQRFTFIRTIDSVFSMFQKV